MNRSYKLIKEYPNSPKLGTIVEDKHLGPVYFEKDGNRAYAFKLIENYPEFWQLIKKDKKSLFLDELGNEIFEGDNFYYVNPMFWDLEKGKALDGDLRGGIYHFKNKEDAEKYIEDNKPRFSKKQILDVLHTIDCDTNKESMILLYIKLRLGL